MKSVGVILLTILLCQICQASQMTYEIVDLVQKEEELDCENTDFIQLESDYDAYSQVIELVEKSAIDEAVNDLQSLSDHTAQIISHPSKQFIQDPRKELDALQAQLEQITMEFKQHHKQYFVDQCEQVRYQIVRCYDAPPEQRKAQLAMLRGLIEYLISSILRLRDQAKQHQITQQIIHESRIRALKRREACIGEIPQPQPQRIQQQNQRRGQQIYGKGNVGTGRKEEQHTQQQQQQQNHNNNNNSHSPRPNPQNQQSKAENTHKQQQIINHPEQNQKYHQTHPRQPHEQDSLDVVIPPPIEVGEEVICEDDRPERRPKCVAGSDVILASSFNADEPTVQTEVKQIKDVNEYGFGFWMRFLQLYPGFMKDGLLDQSYFVAKITKNVKDGDTAQGDRLLTLFQTPDSYIFGAQHDHPEKKETTIPIEYGDIEGVWTYVYYSYSVLDRMAIGFYKQSNGQTRQIKMIVHQDQPGYLKFILGGNYATYSGFNGQFSRPVLKIGLGTYLLDADEFEQFAISCNQQPLVPNLQLKPYTFEREPLYYDIDDLTTEPKVDTIDVPLPEEYAVSGWFKWDPIPEQQQNWHTMFRLANTPKRKQQIIMGERSLAAWLGKPKGGQIHFSTYSYANMRGAGNPNAHQFIPHNNMHTHWHFVYFGYSRTLRKAYAQVQFKDQIKSVSFINVNHYLSPRHYFYYGREKQFPHYSGFIAFLEVFMCKGSYQQPVKPSYKPAPTPLPPRKKCVEGPGRVISSAYNKGPVVQVELHKEDLKDTSQYGFGFWFRYLSLHPTPYETKRPDWSLLAKLTNLKESTDFRDGLLSMFQGQIGYFYISTDVRTKKQYETAQPFKDIEGVWTYTYFSYTKFTATAFIQQVGSTPSILDIKSKHPRFDYLYFQVGGKDPKNAYASFNGQFSRPVLRLGSGTYFGFLEDLNQFCLACNPVPQDDCQARGGLKAVSKKTTKFTGKPINTTDKFGISNQYGVQGWFKWNGKEATEPQLLFRLTTSEGPATKLNQNTLSVYFNPADQTLQFLTYSYIDTHNNGNPKVSQIMEGKAFVHDWFHIYFAYSRSIRQADVIVEHSQGKGQLTFKNINHYLAPTMLLYYGKDEVNTKPFDGWIYGMNLLVCDITYSPTPKPPEDCAPVKEPICLNGEQYENISLANIDTLIADLQKKKALLENKQWVPEVTQCYCYQSKFKDRKPQGFLEIGEGEGEEEQSIMEEEVQDIEE